MSWFSELFTKGLLSGFAGKSKISSTQRGGFSLASSHFTDEDGGVYHDEWLADRVGGGHELIQWGKRQYSRVYGGGTIHKQELNRLGLSQEEVIEYLVKKLQELGDKTRLLDDCEPKVDGDWRYEYRVIEEDGDVPVAMGREAIFYHGHLVFVHAFVLCPVE